MITVWGLKSCDTCRKARAWLDGRDIDYEFKDARVDGLAVDDIAAWLDAVGGEVLVNRRGTTWRGLNDTEKARAEDPDTAATLLAGNPALIKRPVFVAANGAIIVGFGVVQQKAVEALT